MHDAGVSLYIHVPFCAAKCSYCDFVSMPIEPATPAARPLLERFCDAVVRDLRVVSAAGLLDDVPTVYIGGGTPSLLGPLLVRLVEAVRALPGVHGDAEVTCEANPESFHGALARSLADAGVTRVSLGVQSLDDDVLRWLGRRHDAKQALAAAAAACDAGLSLSIDLMCGIPVLSACAWDRTLGRAVATGCDHVSVYPLTIEPMTPLAACVDPGAVHDGWADRAAAQMVRAAEVLAAAGFVRYEVSNYALPGRECRHNLRYWTGGAYIGIGPAAASMLPAALVQRVPFLARSAERPATAARARFAAGPDLHGFLENPWGRHVAEVEWLTEDEANREDAMLGMRLAAGITRSMADRAGVTTALEELEHLGLVERADGRWRTTQQGWLLGNEVFTRLWFTELR